MNLLNVMQKSSYSTRKKVNEADGDTVEAVARLNAERLDQLPLKLIEERRHPTLSGNKRFFDTLILQVRETKAAGSAPALLEPVDKYEYHCPDVIAGGSMPSVAQLTPPQAKPRLRPSLGESCPSVGHGWASPFTRSKQGTGWNSAVCQ
jgi:hypothetical protein